MKIYIVKRLAGDVDYDEYDSIVVRADNADRAKLLASQFQSYFIPNEVNVIEIYLDDQEGIVHKSFCAG